MTAVTNTRVTSEIFNEGYEVKRSGESPCMCVRVWFLQGVKEQAYQVK